MKKLFSKIKQIIASIIKPSKKKSANQESIFREELEYEELDDYTDALEKVRRAIQMAHNNEIQGERMVVSFVDGYANHFFVIIGKEEDLLSDDTFKNSSIRERFYFTQRKAYYMAIGISEDKLPAAAKITIDYSGNCER